MYTGTHATDMIERIDPQDRIENGTVIRERAKVATKKGWYIEGHST